MTTTRFHVGFTLTFQCSPGVDFEAVIDSLYRELLDTEERDEGAGIVDPDMSANLTQQTVDVEMIVVKDDPMSAHLCAATALRAAAHAVGIGTPGWEVDIATMTAEVHALSDLLQDA